jgi:Alpha/beta hydrolase domain
MKRAVVVTVFLLTWVAALGAESVPNPNVTGPVAALAAPGDSSHNYTFFSTNVDLASKGYVEQEFFFEGTANTYNIDPSVPKSDNAEITSSGNSYKTRMVVRRPLSAKDFKGTVLMEWLNVTGGYDLDALWLASHDHLIREGYAWIGVSAQRPGLYTPYVGLHAWSHTRYDALSIPDTTAIAGEPDGLSWDIFSQAARAVRHPQGTDPMGGLKVKCIFAVGWSQSANRLAVYHNSIHPLAQVFDAFGLIGVDGIVLLPLRTDLKVKVFKVQPETFVAGNGVAISQALLDVQEPNTDHFRRWEVAGASQVGYHELQEVVPLLVRDIPISLSSLPSTCESPKLSRIPWHYVLNAAYDSLVKWVKDEEPPAIAPDIAVMTYAQAPDEPSVLLRDIYGNVLGGIRLSQIAVPTATNTGENGPLTNMCRYLGSYVPFDADTLKALYPDHQTYVDLVIEATRKNKSHGFIDRADAEETIREAVQSDVGK